MISRTCAGDVALAMAHTHARGRCMSHASDTWAGVASVRGGDLVEHREHVPTRGR